MLDYCPDCKKVIAWKRVYNRKTRRMENVGYCNCYKKAKPESKTYTPAPPISEHDAELLRQEKF